MMKNINAVAFQPKHQMAYSKIDFGDFVTSNDIEDTIIINLHLDHMIEHTFPKIDRCCSLKGKKVDFDGVDNMERIDCSIDQEEFTKKYVDTREAIIMSGCQTKWKATNWTIGNILDRYITPQSMEKQNFSVGIYLGIKTQLDQKKLTILKQVKSKI